MVSMLNVFRSQVAVLALAGCLVMGCSGGADTNSEQSQQNSSPAGATTGADSSGGAPAAAPATLGDLFPYGEGRDAVLNNCSACHSVACSVIGQRSRARWDGLRELHGDRVADAELHAAFEYLKANFDDSKPEPKVPPEFMVGGCTPPA